MTETDIALSSLALDLKRVALASHGGSAKTAARFAEEALKRKSEIDLDQVKPYIRKYLDKIPKILKNKNRVAEDALMYSTIFQNYVLYSE